MSHTPKIQWRKKAFSNSTRIIENQCKKKKSSIPASHHTQKLIHDGSQANIKAKIIKLSEENVR